jgi:hypothetical protein
MLFHDPTYMKYHSTARLEPEAEEYTEQVFIENGIKCSRLEYIESNLLCHIINDFKEGKEIDYQACNRAKLTAQHLRNIGVPEDKIPWGLEGRR